MNPIVIGCNYHTTWQSQPGMRFKLTGIDGNKAHLKSWKSDFYTDINSLIFIESAHNIAKAKRIRSMKK